MQPILDFPLRSFSFCRTTLSPHSPLPTHHGRRGLISDALSANFVYRNTLTYAPKESSLTNQTLSNYGGQWTFYSVVATDQVTHSAVKIAKRSVELGLGRTT